MNNDNNKLSCAIVRDLLPLYHDGVVSGETEAAVTDHIADCADCSAELERLDAKLPEIKESSAKRFISMMKRNKLMLILKYSVCYALVLLAVYGLIRFACNKPVIKLGPEDIEAARVYHYKNEDCDLPYCPHALGSDNSIFVYCTMPSKTAASLQNMKISRENGNVEMTFYKTIINTAANYNENYGKIYGDIYIIPLQEGDRSLSINGKVIWQEGDPEPEPELPPYVEAYHTFEYGGQDASWYTENTEGIDSFTLECDGKRTVWDIDGKVIAKEAYDEMTGEWKRAE